MTTLLVTNSLPTPSINISSPSACYSTTNHHSSSNCTVVPQYPYNVSMPPFAGALLPYERAPMPDDNDVQTRLPSRCVDYLSHDWDESDVWTSWKAMTRHKNGLANGVRLENASWRTWAKQRSNLKTISPETLNWLKDSDVTWLYGPLHTAVDPVPPPKVPSIHDRFNLHTQQALQPESAPGSALNSRPGSSASVRSVKVPGKPILKHRSLSEILGVGLQSSPSSSRVVGDSIDDTPTQESNEYPNPIHFNQPQTTRVTMAHTASDLTMVNQNHPQVGHSSPPAPGTGSKSSDLAAGGGDTDPTDHSSAHHRTESMPKTALRTNSAPSGHSPHAEELPKPKKHISFSHRVEQCIAVDSEEERGVCMLNTGKLKHSARTGYSAAIHPAGLKEEEEEEEDDDDDDEDDVLTFRSSAPRQPSLHAVSHRFPIYSVPSYSPNNSNGYHMGPHASSSTSVSMNEPYTIARMAPTTLKSSEVLPAPSPVVVSDRPSPWSGLQSHFSSSPPHSAYTVTCLPSGPSTPKSDCVSQQPPHPHSSNPVPGPARSSQQSSPSYPSHTYGPVSSKVLASPIVSPAHDDHFLGPIHSGSSTSINQWTVNTPDHDDTEEFTAIGFDYFSGPDLGLGDEYDTSRLPSQHLASFHNGFNPPEPGSRMMAHCEDHSSLTSTIKADMTSPPFGSPVRGVVRPHRSRCGFQEPILVPQVRSTSYRPSLARSSSSSSLSSSPLSHLNDSSSASSLTNPNTTEKPVNSPILTASTSSSTSLGHYVQDRPDRISRGRSSSRGSSASSFERSAIDRRPPSNSPSHSPPAHVIPVSIGSIVHGITRPGGIRAHSYDGIRTGRPSLINVTIGEEAEYEDDQSSASPQQTVLGSGHLNSPPSIFSSHSGIGDHPAADTQERSAPVQATSPQSVRQPHCSSSLLSLHKPCLISPPKPASAQLDGSSTHQGNLDGPEKGDSGSRSRAVGNGASEGTGSPTLRSLLSQQSSSSSSSMESSTRSIDERVSPREWTNVARRSSARVRHPDTGSVSGRCCSGNGVAQPAMLGGRGRLNEVMRRLSGDEFGLVNYYGEAEEFEEGLKEEEEEEEEEEGGMMSRAVDIVGTARELVGALWSVGSRSLWSLGKEAGEGRVYRRASTGGLGGRREEGVSEASRGVGETSAHGPR